MVNKTRSIVELYRLSKFYTERRNPAIRRQGS